MIRSFAAVMAGVAWLAAGPVPAQTLDAVAERERLNCGIDTDLVGFASRDASGNWNGFDIAFCRAVAGAVLGDPQAVDITLLEGERPLDALRSGEIDLVARASTYTRDLDPEFDLVGVSYYDGQGFIVPKESGITSARELDEAQICVRPDSTDEEGLEDFFGVNEIRYRAVDVAGTADALEKYSAGDCEAYTTDAAALAASRATFESPQDHVILPEIITKEPLGPLVRHDDDRWTDVVRWVLQALIAAEEYQITSANITDLAGSSDDPRINRLLGDEGDLGGKIGLPADWAVRAIEAGGNYGEIFERYIGELTPIGLNRGLNAQWTDGGLLYAPPFR